MKKKSELDVLSDDKNSQEFAEDIKKLLSDGMILYGKENFYEPEIYEKALKKFEKAKKLDAKKEYIHHYHYNCALVHVKLAEEAENPAQKQQYYETAIKHFKSVTKYDHDNIYEDINTNIGTVLYNAGHKEEALKYLKNNKSSNLINTIEQELGIDNKGSTNILSKSHNFSYSHKNKISNSDLSKTLPINYKIHHTIYVEDIPKIIYHFQQQIYELNDRVAYLEQACHYARIFDIAWINKKVLKLESKYPDLYKYYNEFNWTLKTTIDVCADVSTGLLVVDAGHIERKSATAATKLLCYLLDLIAIGPYGSIITFLHDAGDNAYNTKAEGELLKKLNSLFNMMKSKFNNASFQAIDIQQLALVFTYLNKNTLLNINNANPPQDDSPNTLKEIIGKKFAASKQVAYKCFTTPKKIDAISNLAFQDVASVLSYLYDNHESIENNKEPFIKQILSVVKNGELSKIWLNKIQYNSSEVEDNILLPIEYDMLQIETNLGEISNIRNKIKTGQWENEDRSTVNVRWTYLRGWIPFPNGAEASLSGKSRGIKEFIEEQYYKDQCAKKGIKYDDDSIISIKNFKLFMFREICNGEHELLVQNFIDRYPEVIKEVLEIAPQFFMKKDWVEKFLDTEQNKTKAITAINKHDALYDKYIEKALGIKNIELDFCQMELENSNNNSHNDSILLAALPPPEAY